MTPLSNLLVDICVNLLELVDILGLFLLGLPDQGRQERVIDGSQLIEMHFGLLVALVSVAFDQVLDLGDFVIFEFFLPFLEIFFVIFVNGFLFQRS